MSFPVTPQKPCQLRMQANAFLFLGNHEGASRTTISPVNSRLNLDVCIIQVELRYSDRMSSLLRCRTSRLPHAR